MQVGCPGFAEQELYELTHSFSEMASRLKRLRSCAQAVVGSPTN